MLSTVCAAEQDVSVEKNMAKVKKKLTPAQKKAKKKAKAERQKKYMWVFINGKQVRVKRPETIDGMDMDEFIRRNADPIWLHQNEMWEYIDLEEDNHEENTLGEENKDEKLSF
jgi:hypothetical protein